MNEIITIRIPVSQEPASILAFDPVRAAALAQSVDQIPGLSYMGLADRLAILLNQSDLSAGQTVLQMRTSTPRLLPTKQSGLSIAGVGRHRRVDDCR